MLIPRAQPADLIEDTVSKGTARSDGEEIAAQTLSVRVDVEQCWSLHVSLRVHNEGDLADRLVPTADHRTLHMSYSFRCEGS